MSHYQVAEEVRKALAFSPYLTVEDAEPREAIGESWLRLVGQDGLHYGVVVLRVDELEKSQES